VIDNPDLRVQVFAGARNLNVDASAHWLLQGPLNQFPQEGEVSEEADAWDGLIGVRGAATIEHWVFPYYLDVGAGDSALTWQAMIGSYRLIGAKSASIIMSCIRAGRGRTHPVLDLSDPHWEPRSASDP
jgi:hypothetical protein